MALLKLIKMFPPFRIVRNFIWTVRESVSDVINVYPKARRHFAVVIALTVPLPVLESIGLTMVLPLLEFIERKGNIGALQSSSIIWRYLTTIYDIVGIRIELWSLSLLLLLLLLLRQTLHYLRTLVFGRAKFGLEAALRDKLIRSSLQGSATELRRMGVGTMADLSTQQVASGAGIVIRLFELIGAFWTLIVFGMGLLLIAPAVTLASAVAVCLIGLLFAPFVRLLRRLSSARVARQQLYGSWFVQLLMNWKTVKLFGTEDREIARARTRNAELVNIGIAAIKTQFLASSILTIGGFAMILLAINIAGRFEDLSGGILLVVILAAIRLLPLVQSLVDLVQGLVSNKVSLEATVAHAARFEKSKEDVLRGTAVPALREAIRFESVGYTYDNSVRPALNDIRIVFPARTVTIVAGHSGAGKSTLIDLLPGLINPTSGRITYDNVPYSELCLSSLRREIAVLEQSPLMFNDTIFENVRYGRPTATIDEVSEACSRAGALEFIEQTHSGFQTRLGENGSGLSGGQLQRIALARALLSKAHILILDEPTSSVDAESELVILTALRSAADSLGLTVIMITHQETPDWFVDRKIVLKDGRVTSVEDYDRLKSNRMSVLAETH